MMHGVFSMGVRLYDPKLGRFLEVDPIEGGSANDYDYCAGDPVNCYDLGGTTKSTECRVVFDFVHRVCTAAENKANKAAAAERDRKAREAARRQAANEARSRYVKPPLQPWEPYSNPIGDALATALHPVGAAIHATAGRVTRAAVGCATFTGPGAVAGGAIGLPFGVAPATATAGAAGGCIGGMAYGILGPEYPAP